MKSIVKIATAVALVFLLMGIACATDINNLKVPDKWESIGGGSYHEIGDSHGAGSGRNMMIQKMTDSIKEDYFNNHTDENYYVFSNGDDTFNYTDGDNKDYGCFEVVNIDGTDYFVVFSTNVNYEFDKDTVSGYDLMLEFNKLNNLKPVAV